MNEGNLGNLVVTISANLEDLAKGLTQAQTQVNDTSKKIADATTKISTGLVAMGGAITGAFGAAVKSTVQYGEEIYRASERTGIATETLSRLKFVADQCDISFEAVSNGVKFLQRAMYDAEQGTGKYKEAFRTLGLSVTNSNGKLKDADVMLLEIADVFSKSEDAAAKTAIAMQIFGRAGAQLVPVLNMGSQGIRELMDTADKLGITLSEQNAKQLADYSDNWKQFRTALAGVQLAIVNDVLPAFNNFINKASAAVAQVKAWSDQNKELSKNIVNITLSIGGWALAIGTLGLAVVGVGKALTSMWTALNAIVPLMSSLAVIQAFAMTESVVSISAAFGWWPATIAIIGAGLAGWGMEKLMEQIPGVSAFLDRLFGVAKENRPMRNGKVMSPSEEKQFDQENGIGGVDLGKITVSKPKSALGAKGSDPLAEMEQRKAALQQYADWYKMMQDGLVTIDGNAAMAKVALAQQETQEKMNFVQLYNQEWTLAHQSMYALATNLISTLQTGLSNAITGIIMGTTKAKDAFKVLGETMVQAVVQFLVQQAVAWAISKAMGAAAQAVAIGMAASLTAAWAPAAFLASVATLGGAVGAGTAALGTGLAGAIAMGATTAASVAGAGAGGLAEGTDTVPAMLSPGEMVVPRSFADGIRSGSISLSGGNGGSTDNSRNATVTINFQATVNNEMDMERAAEQLGLIMEQKLRGVR